MENIAISEDLVLGLDLGVSSIGWVVLDKKNKNEFTRIVDSGVRIFEAGMDGDISSGKADSHALARRNARQIRRQTQRRARRSRKVMYRLQEMRLLSEGTVSDIIPPLDKELAAKYQDVFDGSKELTLSNILPYWLRKRALDEKLSPYELGRVFYHLSQRRGFLSNRKSAARDNEELGTVKEGINNLWKEIEETRSRTLGEYFTTLNPHEQRIRQRWTHRDMYRQEFDAIWASQKGYHDCLTQETYKTLSHALFHQRPLKSAKHLVGKCSLEKSSRRAPYASLEAQEFRLISMVNNCTVITPDGEIRPFTDEERNTLLEHLRTEGDITFNNAKKLLGFKARSTHFNLEEGGETRFVGNRVNASLKGIFGDKWLDFDNQKKNLIINDLRCVRQSLCLFERGINVYGLDKEQAEKFAELELEDSYCNLSRKAIKKVLPLMQTEKMTYAEARCKIYGESLQAGEPLNIIRPVNKFSDIRNPVVSRVLTETRKVVNNIVRKHGKPGRIRIELARDMKNSASQRQAIAKRNRANEGNRKKIADRIIANTNIKNPRRDDILKVQLADECDWICPYTGKQMCWNSLFGSSPSFDIEHIIPFSRSLDDSFANKTLCDSHYNRNIKKNRGPGEYVQPGSDQWDTIMGAVSRFSGDKKVTAEKLRRFQLTTKHIEELTEEFPSNQLNDTRYASRLACEYLGELYGGQVDAEGIRRIQAAKGNITYYLREAWQLNHILGDGVKNRDDHRHHVVDALVVALMTPATIQRLTNAAVQNYERSTNKGRFKMPKMPWDNFWEDAKNAIDDIIVSHRVNHKVNGPLHQESNFAPVSVIENGKVVNETHIRRELAKLKINEVNKIVSSVVRSAVKAKLVELDTDDPAKAFSDPANHPCMKAKDGRMIPIHKARIKISASPVKIGQDRRERYCTTGSNHHMEIFAILDDQGKEIKWDAAVVSTLEAMRRKAKHQPIVNRDHGPSTKFKFSISPGDTFCLNKPKFNMPKLVHIRCVPESQQIMFCALNDARKQADIKKAKEWFSSKVRPFKELEPEKVIISPLGRVWTAND